MSEKLTACKDCSHLVWEWEGDYFGSKEDAAHAKYIARYEKSMGGRTGPIPDEIRPVCRAKTGQAFDPVEGKMVFVERHVSCGANNPDGHCKYFAQKASEIVVLPPGTLGVPWYRRWFGKSKVSKQNRLVNAQLEEQ